MLKRDFDEIYSELYLKLYAYEFSDGTVTKVYIGVVNFTQHICHVWYDVF